MNIKQYKPFLLVSIISVLALLIHKTIFLLFAPNHLESEFVYSLPELYCIFFLLSAFILLILIKISQINMTNVGFIFILLTTFKMGVAYVFLKPILKSNLPNASIEKINFLLVFLLFLTIETCITIRIINTKKQ
jgi:hypothetical protein